MIAHAIPPLYWLAERSSILRGRALRKPVQQALAELSSHQSESARRAFESASPGPEWLDIAEVEPLIARHASRPTRRDRRAPADKSQARAREVERSISRAGIRRGARLVDLAAGDGKVAEALHDGGHDVTAIDLRPLPSPIRAGFAIMDASHLTFADNSVDAIYSFDAFEHFGDPAAVLAEVHRVLRPGGVLYASFGPLYHSPQGAHQWFSVDLPYVHLLFHPQELDARADRLGTPRITRNLNYWPLARYRQLFASTSGSFRTVWKYEKPNVSHADMIERFPGIFRARTDDFDELIVRSIEVLLEKR